MQRQLLDLVPKRYLCPYCGEWHEWEGQSLGYYDSEYYSTSIECSNAPSGCNEGNYKVFFKDGYCYYSTERQCGRGRLELDGKIEIASITESSDEPIVTFKVPFKPNEPVGSMSCSSCRSKYVCNLVKLADKGYDGHMEITLGFEFEQSDYDRLVRSARKSRESKQHMEQSIQQGNKEDTTMANSIFNMNVEFGLNKDENIASTLMGVAVKNGDSWRIYNKDKKEITDVGDMQLGNLPIFILPTTKLSEGDLIKDAGEYYFVIKVEEGSTQTMCAKTGAMKTAVPIKNVLGFNCYSKVIALSDSLNIDCDFDMEKLAIMSAMFSQSSEDGGQMNQLLPLMLFKDKLGGDDDTMKLVLMSSMMTNGEGGGQMMNQLLPLMLFKDKLGEDDDKMKVVLMSSMMGGNMAGSNNQLMSYLMLDTFMSKKDGNAPQKTGDGTAE